MFELEFSRKVNNNIISALKYISEVLEAPEDHYNEKKNIVLLYRFLYSKRDWQNILSSEE